MDRAEVGSMAALMAGDGEVGRLLLAHDWSSTSLGPIQGWPAPLRTAVQLMLGSRMPMFVVWGDERIVLYNDDYIPILAERHPWALGRRYDELWPVVHGKDERLIDQAYAGKSSFFRDLPVMLERHGVTAQAWFTFSFTPVLDQDGGVGGAFCVCSETTETMLAEQASAFQIELENRLRGMLDPRQIIDAAQEAVGARLGVSRVGYGDVEEPAGVLTAPGSWTDGAVLPGGGRHDLGAFGPDVLEGLRRGETFVVEDAQTDQRFRSKKVRAAFEALEIAATVTVGLLKEGRLRAALYVHQSRPRRWTAREIALIQGVAERTWAAVERARAEAQLRESEDHYRHVVELNPQVVWTAAADGELDRVAHRWLEWTGTDGLGVTWAMSTHPDDRRGGAEAWAHCVATGEPFDIEHRTRLLNGDYHWMRSRAFPRRNARGEIVRWYGTTEDIHEQRVAEAAARAKDIQFQTFAQAMPNHVWSATPDGRLDWINAQVHEYSGAAAGDLDGAAWTDLLHPDDLAGAAATWAESLATGATYETSFRIRRHDGAYRWHLVRALPIAGPDGEIERWIGTNTDIENEKQNAAALAQLNATLEERVAERTREREEAQEQLRQSQKMEAVGQLTGGIAHDFNNLLQGIIGSLDLVQKRIEQGRTQELNRFVAGAMTSANRAAALTHRLLAFSRRQPLDPKPVKVNPLIASMEDLLRRSLGEHVVLELVLAGGLWRTLCDPNQLESAILNLCINGRDAMPDGGKLTIETCNSHLDGGLARQRGIEPGQYVCICVTDNGVGMSPELIEKAFEPFFTTKPIGQGTGLGLSMIYGFARQSEGHVKIYSEADHGTSVKLYLPRHRGDVVEDEAVPTLGEAHRADAGETVLVVEDEPVVRGLIIEVLNDLGYEALEADDGPSGLEILMSGRRIDLMVTDIGLPGLNGRQLADAGRERRPGLKILFMTGYAENAALASGFLEPGMQMVTKPFAMEALATRIREMVRTA